MVIGSDLATYDVPGREPYVNLRRRVGRKLWQKTLK